MWHPIVYIKLNISPINCLIRELKCASVIFAGPCVTVAYFKEKGVVSGWCIKEPHELSEGMIEAPQEHPPHPA